MTQLTVTYAAGQTSSAAALPWLKIAQPDYSGQSNLADISTLMAMITLAQNGQNAQQGLPPCAGLGRLEDGTLAWTTSVYVSTSATAGPYELKASRGEYGAMSVEPVHHEQSFTFGKTDQVDVGAQLSSGWTYVWETPVYDHQGQEIPPPTLTASGQFLVADRSCLGVVRLQYDTSREVHPLTIPDNGTEDAFAATVSCFWSGGVEQLDVETAPCVADRLAACGDNPRLPGFSITPKDKGTTLHVEYDACYGNVLGSYYA